MQLKRSQSALAKSKVEIARLQAEVARLKTLDIEYRTRLAAVPAPGPDHSDQVMALKMQLTAVQVVILSFATTSST